MNPQLFLMTRMAVLIFIGIIFLVGLEIREWMYAFITWYSRKHNAEKVPVS